MKFIKYVTIILSIFTFSCIDTFEREVEMSVHEQLRRFPKSQLQDLYKNFYQDRFGPEHLILDSSIAEDYLKKELDSYSEGYFPLIEEIGWEKNFYRVSLDVIKLEYIPHEVYLEAFIESANRTSKISVKKWEEEWTKILSVIDQMNLNLPDYELDKEKIQNQIDSGECTMHHSETFSKYYDPHYRIIRKDLFLQKVRPYLE